jgi:glycyl-tRNA synthetase beta chain
MPNFLLELGTEELPAEFVQSAVAQWESLLPNNLADRLLAPQAIKVYGTPRRLALLLEGLPASQPNRQEIIKGPPAAAAFKNGRATPAAAGFAQKHGVEVGELEIRETEKGAFVFAKKTTFGLPVQDLLGDLSLGWIASLEGRRFMRWGDGDLRFPRPIRWLVAMLDERILPLELVNGSTHLKSGRFSQGHRVLHPDPVKLRQATDYETALAAASVLVDPVRRRQVIQSQIENLAVRHQAIAEIPPTLLAEVTNLVEYPTAILGNFDREFLNLPTEVITTVMVTHQRYFPVKAADGSLLPHFITIANGDRSKAALIAGGNERVIRARLADAQFFYQADCDEPLDSYLPQLETVVFQEELGTMRDKVDRLMEIAQQISQQLDLPASQCEDVESTAMLCKADLVTQMVYEFPELQGIMGQKYALASGESEAVARGIFEHYLPRGAEDDLPQSLTGQIVGIADRLDTLVSIFGLGLIPSGSSDPFALRRAANAIISVIWHAQLPIDLDLLLTQGCGDFVTAHSERQSPLATLQSFFIQRVHTLLQDERQIDYDLVNAVLGEGDPDYRTRALTDLLDVRDRADFLQEIRGDGTLGSIYETVNRSARLAGKGDLDSLTLDPQGTVDPQYFEKNSERELYEALLQLLPQTLKARESHNYRLLVGGLERLAPIVSRFFDGEDSVLVMAENPEVKRNRLNLLGLLRNHGRVLADFKAIVKT